MLQAYNLPPPKNIRDTMSTELFEDIAKCIFIPYGHFISVVVGVPRIADRGMAPRNGG
jgi:hypothetical protein